MNRTPAWDPGATGSVRMAPHMSVCPRGSSSSARRHWSAWRTSQSRFSSIVRPRGEGKPSTISRSGPPAAWASMVRMTWQEGLEGKTLLPFLPFLPFLPLSALFCGEISFLLRHPGVEVGLALDGHETAHAVVTEPAQLGARDLVVEIRFPESVAHLFGRDRRYEPDGNVHAGDRILLHPHFVKAEAVNHVLAGQVDENRPVDRQVQLVDGRDVVFRVRIGAIETERVVSRHDFDVDAAGLPAAAGVPHGSRKRPRPAAV